MAGRYKAYDKLSSTREVIIEDFPEHWTLTRIKFNSLVKARVGWHGLKSDDFTEVGPYLVTGSDFKGKFIQWKNCYHCDEERYEQDPYIQLTNGDLLITKDGTIGKVALVSQLDGKATLNSGVFVVRPLRSDYTTQYYYWLLLSRSFTDFVDYYKTGSTIAHLYQETFVNFKYPLPPYEEQQKIASFLDHETAKIDILIAKQEKLIELLKEKRQAVISQAVTKGLNPNAPMRDSGVEWLGEVPEHWDVTNLKYYASIQGGYAFNSNDFVDNGIQILRIGNVYQSRLALDRQPTFVSDTLFEQLSEFRVMRNDILMSLTGTLGKRDYGFAVKVDVDGNFLMNQRVAKLTPLKQKITRSYLLNILWSEPYLNQLYALPSGTKQANLSNSDVLGIAVAIPTSKEEQTQIAEYIKEKILKLDALTSKAEDTILLMKERKTALISAAVTGKIDVRDFVSEQGQPQGV